MAESPHNVEYPASLQEIVDLFEMLPEQERRENLMSFAQAANTWEPKEGETFAIEDDRRDAECTDRVGIYINISSEGTAEFRVSLGPNVQTLTRAMTTILCRGLSGQRPEVILNLKTDFVPRIIGEELIRMRSRTVYYILDRIKGTLRTLDLDRV